MSSESNDKPPELSANWRSIAVSGLIVIVVTFGVGGGWSAMAKIDRAVIATAFVAVESNRKVIQHLEGGIVQENLVREGQAVKEGEVLLRLSQTQAQASSDVVNIQIMTALAVEARLTAERDFKDSIVWPAEIEASRYRPQIAQLVSDQSAQFTERRASLTGQLNVQESRISQLATEISGIRGDRASMQEQIKFISEELVGLRELYKDNLVTINRLHAMERERSRLEGLIGRSVADEAKAEGQINELQLQVSQLKQKFNEEVAGQMSETRQKISELREKIAVANDVLSRVEILAPRAGTIQNLKVSTVGQVIRSGESLMEIVPEGDPLVIHAQFSPTDIDAVKSGQEVEIRFPAFHSRVLPLMLGRLESVSSDRLTDEKTGNPYFLGLVSIESSHIPPEYRLRLRSGMPAEVIASAGERTVLEYMISPLTTAMRKTFREQ